MNLARHPKWLWIKRVTFTPSTISRVLRGVASIALGWIAYHFTGKAIWLLVVFYTSLILPTVLVTALDVILRIQFSLMTLLVAVVTLQIPMLFIFVSDSALGISLGADLLLIWFLALCAFLKIRPAGPYESSEAGRWRRIEPGEVASESEKPAE